MKRVLTATLSWVLIPGALAIFACSPKTGDGDPKDGSSKASERVARDASGSSEARGRAGHEDRRGGSEARGSDQPERRAGRSGEAVSRGGRPGSGGPRSGGPRSGGSDASRGVPVEVALATRDSISLFFETNGALEAENEVDLVSRVAGPIVELKVEEGDRVRAGQVLARIDDRELRTQLAATTVRLDELAASYERTRSLYQQQLVSRDAFDQALAASQTAKAEHERLEVLLTYTEIEAPFPGLVVERYVKFAESLQNGSRLFRLSDFDPLLCPIRVPERQLQKLRVGQRARLRVEAFGEREFDAEVLRIRPVVDAVTGTIEVTLKVVGEGLLRPGMFASVALEMERRNDAVVVPKAALALDSLQPTVFVLGDGVAIRRQLELGFRNDQKLEVLSGLQEGEKVVVVGQDGLADGTPLEVLVGPGSENSPASQAESGQRDGRAAEASSSGRSEPRRAARRPDREGRRGLLRDIDLDDPEDVEKIKTRMRERGLTEDEIEERLERVRQRRAGGAGQSGGRAGNGL